ANPTMSPLMFSIPRSPPTSTLFPYTTLFRSASPTAGIDPLEPFDVSPYAHKTFEYFLRNPICAEMGRKIKISFSSSDRDTAFSYIHDFGFIPKVKIVDGEEVRGFKVLLGGGLGSQPLLAHEIFDFLAEDQIIPYMEATLRV